MRTKVAGAVEKKGSNQMGSASHREDDFADQLHSAAEIAKRLDRLETLTWAMLDEQISEQELAELESLLTVDQRAREHYIRCVQLHTDLAQHFTPVGKAGSKDPVQVLGFLGDAAPKFGASSARELK
ncbi:MAG: hypothetical protein U0805_01300 [Pirellulales bacterium]